MTVGKNAQGDYYAIHQRYHQVHKLNTLIDSNTYSLFLNQKEAVQEKLDSHIEEIKQKRSKR